MSKYERKQYEQGKAMSLEEGDIAEVMITSAIQELIRVKGADNYVTKQFLFLRKVY